MFFFRRDREILRAFLRLAHGQCMVAPKLPLQADSRERYRLFQTLYVTFMARLLYGAGKGEAAEQIRGSNRALFNEVLHLEVDGMRAGESLRLFRELRLVTDLPAPVEQHCLVLKQRKDNSVYCDITSQPGESRLLPAYGLWSLVKYGEQQFGGKVYRDLSDALHRMNRFYRDMPYWQREGLLTVPRLTLGIMGK